jgi:DNA-directed RNA polymerase III subunit RPC4
MSCLMLVHNFLIFLSLIPTSSICIILEALLLQVNPGAESRMVQHAVAVNTKEKHCCLLGEIVNRHVIVTPDVDSLLKDN